MRNGKRNEKAASENPNSKANVLIQTRPRAHYTTVLPARIKEFIVFNSDLTLFAMPQPRFVSPWRACTVLILDLAVLLSVSCKVF